MFLVDTSDSFNKLDNSSSAAGNVVLEKWIMPLLKKGKIIFPVWDLDERGVPGNHGPTGRSVDLWDEQGVKN